MGQNIFEIMSFIALIAGGYGSLTGFFAKRELASNDALKKESAENTGKIALLEQAQEQHEKDIERVEALAKTIEADNKTNLRDLNKKLDEMLKGIQTIQQSCAGHLAREKAFAQLHLSKQDEC